MAKCQKKGGRKRKNFKRRGTGKKQSVEGPKPFVFEVNINFYYNKTLMINKH